MTKREKYAQYIGKWVMYCDPAGSNWPVHVLSVDNHGESAWVRYDAHWGKPDDEVPTRHLDV